MSGAPTWQPIAGTLDYECADLIAERHGSHYGRPVYRVYERTLPITRRVDWRAWSTGDLPVGTHLERLVLRARGTLMPLCPRCHGNPHRYEAGCCACDDSGYERAPERSEDDEERIAAMYREENDR